MKAEVIAYLVASLMVELLVLAYMMRTAWTHRKQIADRMRQLRSLAWKHPSLWCHSSPEDREVSEGIFEFRCWVGDRMLNFFVAPCFTASLTAQVNLLQHQDGFISQVQMWILLVMVTIILTCKLNNHALKPWLLSAEYVTVSICSLAYVSKWSVPPEHFTFFSLAVLALFRMPSVVFATRTWEVVAMNMLFLIQAFWRASYDDFPNEESALYTAAFAVRTEFLLFLTVLVFSFVMDRILYAKSQLALDRRNLATQLSAASSLLRLTCDAVIELDSEMRVTEDSPELACMLMNSSPGSTMKGANFLDFMASEDAQRAATFLGVPDQDPQSEGSAISSTGEGTAPRSPARQSITARAFHTRLVDSYNTKICMEVFQVKYSKLDGSTCNLLGLRDFTDVKSLAGHNAEDAKLDGGDVSAPVSDSMPLPLYMSPRTPSEGSPEGPDEDETPLNKEMHLELDMEGLLVHAASAPLVQLVGKSLREVFPSPHTSLLLQSLHSEAKFSPSFNRHLTFKDLPLAGLRAKTGTGTGSMQVVRNRYDQTNVLMSFKKITGLRGGVVSPHLSPPGLSRSLRKPSSISSL